MRLFKPSGRSDSSAAVMPWLLESAYRRGLQESVSAPELASLQGFQDMKNQQLNVVGRNAEVLNLRAQSTGSHHPLLYAAPMGGAHPKVSPFFASASSGMMLPQPREGLDFRDQRLNLAFDLLEPMSLSEDFMSSLYLQHRGQGMITDSHGRDTLLSW